MTVSTSKHARAMVLACPVCAAPAGARCTGLETTSIGHAARLHALDALSKPAPDASCIAALHKVEGQREDTLPFVGYMGGAYDFRLPGSRPGNTTRSIYLVDSQTQVGAVRGVLVDLAARHGLIVLAGSGRGRYVVTARGAEFYRAWLRGSLTSAYTGDSANLKGPHADRHQS